MSSEQIVLIEGKDAEVVNLYVELLITTTSVIDTIASAVTTFNRAFTATPRVIGSGVARNGALVNVKPTLTTVSLYIRGFSANTLADGSEQVYCTLQGRLA